MMVVKQCNLMLGERSLMLNNSVTSREKPIESEEFLNRMVEALGITIDRRPKGKFRKMES